MQTQSVDQFVGQILGNYRVERFLGKGRLNAVYLARHQTSQRTDALTLYIPSDRLSSEARARFLKRFRKEAAAISTLKHQHILPIYEYGEVAEYPYLVTPYMMDGSLADMLKQNGRYDHTAVLYILEQLVEGLSYAHQRGFIHGTLRPSNVVVSGEDTMQVAGFGLMHMLQLSGVEQGNQPYAHLLSVANTFLAAPEYVAPEVVQGHSIDVRSDVYALGCILFELLCGRPPFVGTDPLETAQQHVTAQIPSARSLNPDLPVVLDAVINQALERDPARRFQQVTELGEAFAMASKGAVQHSQPMKKLGSTVPWMEREDTTTQIFKRFAGIQETPRDSYNTGKWQLVPPIVTGKIPTIQPAAKQGSSLRETFGAFKDTDAQNVVSPRKSGQLQTPRASVDAPMAPKAPAVPAPPTLVPDESYTAAPRPEEFSTQIVLPAPEAPASYPVPRADAPQSTRQNAAKPYIAAQNSMPGAGEDTSELVKEYAWWSQPEGLVAPAPEPEPQPQSRPQPIRQREVQRAQNVGALNWANDMPLPPPSANRRKSAARPADKPVSRRQAVTLLATGSLVAVGAVVGIGILHARTTPAPQQAQTPPTTGTQNKPAATPTTRTVATNNPPAPTKTPATNGNQTQPTQPAQATTGGHTGQVIGLTSLAPDAAISFTNPADQKGSLLVHLPNSTFVAYESACTHQGVTVAYDPASHTLICPLHGATFDPANGGKVLKGPAMLPLPKVTIHVNTDGTITV